MTTILERFEELHRTSRTLHERAVRLFPNGVTHDVRYFRPFPIYVERAQGSRKWDADGNELVDYVMGHGALLLGHNYPEVQQAVARQLERGTHYGASQEREIEWAERVERMIPSAEVVRFTSSGTEATMMAVRLARAHTGRDVLVRFRYNFHGWNDNMVGVPDREGVHPHALGVPDSALANVVVVPQNDLEALRHALQEGDVAAVILEPTGAGWGTIPLQASLLRPISEATREAGAVLIFDEVVTGFRVSPGGVQAASGITPDMTTMAKILAGGLPGGGVAGRREIMSNIDFGETSRADFVTRIPHPGTYNANPLSASAGVATLDVVATGEPCMRASALARSLVARLNDAIGSAGVPGCAFGEASMFHIILGSECPAPIDGYGWNWQDAPSDRMPQTPANVRWALRQGMINEGIDLMDTGGLVSAVHTEADADRTIAAFEATLAGLQAEALL